MTKNSFTMSTATLWVIFAMGIAPYAKPAPLIETTKVVSASYFLSDMIYGEGHPLGKLQVCAELKDSSTGRRTISVSVSMPDSGQVLAAEAPIKTLESGEIAFEFAEDGWGNAGTGILKIRGNNADLMLEQTSWPPDGDKNIGRNYGHFELMKGQCHME